MIEFIKEIALAAGELSLKNFHRVNQKNISFKSEKDLVTEVDKEVEEFLISKIHSEYPDHDIFGEETGHEQRNGEYCWIIDPIDGTTSYVHNQPFYSVSIAVSRKGEICAGVVHAPRLKETFWAEKGNGAWCNGERISVSQRPQINQSVLSTGFACLRQDLPENNLPFFNQIAKRARGVRRFGSAAMDLSYVACARLEGFWEINLKPYDVAAGALIVEEAGGIVTDMGGRNDYPQKGIVASNGLIHNELLDYFKNG